MGAVVQWVRSRLLHELKLMWSNFLTCWAPRQYGRACGEHGTKLVQKKAREEIWRDEGAEREDMVRKAQDTWSMTWAARSEAPDPEIESWVFCFSESEGSKTNFRLLFRLCLTSLCDFALARPSGTTHPHATPTQIHAHTHFATTRTFVPRAQVQGRKVKLHYHWFFIEPRCTAD